MNSGLKGILTAGGRDYDFSGRYRSVTWSGSKGQIARAAAVELPDSLAKQMPTPPGGVVKIFFRGTPLFFGYIVRRRRSTGGGTTTLECMDRGWQLAGNAGWYSFDCSPEAAAKTLCSDFGVPVGSLASTGVTVKRIFPGVELHRIVYTMYSKAAEKTGERYHVGFDGSGRLCVSTGTSGSVRVAPKANLASASYTEDISAICTAVAIYSEEGDLIRTVDDIQLQGLYGRFQHAVTQREGDDAVGEAQTWLDDHREARTVTVDCLGDPRLITGTAVTLAEQKSGAAGRFWIESDRHIWADGVYRCSLTLSDRHRMHTDLAGKEE